MEANEDGYFEPHADADAFPGENAFHEDEEDDEPSEMTNLDSVPSIATYVRRNRARLQRQAKQAAKMQSQKAAEGPSMLEKYEYLWNLRQEVQQPIVVVPTPPVLAGNEADAGMDLVENEHTEQQQQRVQHESTLKFAPDCPEFLGEPVVVVTTFAIGLVTFLWGLMAAFRYWYTGDQNMGRVWWQMSVAIMLLTLMSLVLPPRLRFGYTLYGLMSTILILQYAIFAFAFPLVLPSSDDLAAIRKLRATSN